MNDFEGPKGRLSKEEYEKMEGLDNELPIKFSTVIGEISFAIETRLGKDDEKDLEKRLASARAKFKSVIGDLIKEQIAAGQQINLPERTPEQQAVIDSFIYLITVRHDGEDLQEMVKKELAAVYAELKEETDPKE